MKSIQAYNSKTSLLASMVQIENACEQLCITVFSTVRVRVMYFHRLSCELKRRGRRVMLVSKKRYCFFLVSPRSDYVSICQTPQQSFLTRTHMPGSEDWMCLANTIYPLLHDTEICKEIYPASPMLKKFLSRIHCAGIFMVAKIGPEIALLFRLSHECGIRSLIGQFLYQYKILMVFDRIRSRRSNSLI